MRDARPCLPDRRARRVCLRRGRGALRRTARRPPLGRLGPPRASTRPRPPDALRRHPRGGVPPLGLLVRPRRRPLLDDDATRLQDDGALGKPGRVAPPVGVGPLSRLVGRPLRDPPQAPGRGAVGDRGPVRPRRLLHRPHAPGRRCQPVRAAQPGPGRGHGAESAPSPPGDGDPPAHALFGLRPLLDSVRLRDRRAQGAAPRHQLDPLDPALRPARLDLPVHRHPARRGLVVRRARAGAATGGGTRSRTRRSCRGLSAPPSSTRSWSRSAAGC